MKRIIFLLALSMLTVQAKAQSGTAQAVRYDEASNQVVQVSAPSAPTDAKADTKAATTTTPVVTSAPTPTVIINNNGASASAGPTASSSTPTTTSQVAPTSSSTTSTTVVAPTAAVVVAPAATPSAAQLAEQSRAEELRKARGEMEGHTQEKIVEKLEESRLEGEKARSDKFDAALVGQPQGTSQAPQIVVVPVVTQSAVTPGTPAVVTPQAAATVAPIVVTPATPVAPGAISASAEAVAPPGGSATATATSAPAAPGALSQTPAPVVQAPAATQAPVADHSAPYIETLDSPKSDGPAPRSEYKASTDSQNATLQGAHAYVSGVAGMVNYSGASNLKANGAAGFTVGYVTDKRIVIEGGFLYSNFNIQQNGLYTNAQYPPFENLNQYNMTLAAKYELLPGTFRPFIGAITSYTYRSYTSPNNYYYSYGYGSSSGVSSTGFDIGVTAGLDFQVSSSFSLGFDFRYLTNLTNQTNTAYQQSVNYNGYSSASSLESMSYYTALLSGKFLF